MSSSDVGNVETIFTTSPRSLSIAHTHGQRSDQKSYGFIEYRSKLPCLVCVLLIIERMLRPLYDPHLNINARGVKQSKHIARVSNGNRAVELAVHKVRRRPAFRYQELWKDRSQLWWHRYREDVCVLYGRSKRLAKRRLVRARPVVEERALLEVQPAEQHPRICGVSWGRSVWWVICEFRASGGIEECADRV